jgi:hypothetical protein
MADEDKVVTLGLLWRKTMALAVLPHVTFFAGHRVSSIVEVLSMHSTLCAIEIPFSFVILVFLKVSLKLLALCLHLSLRLTFRTLRVSVFRGTPFAFSFQTSKLLFGKDSFGFAFFQALLACHSARLVTLLMVRRAL